jgi:hypothetical protein
MRRSGGTSSPAFHFVRSIGRTELAKPPETSRAACFGLESIAVRILGGGLICKGASLRGRPPYSLRLDKNGRPRGERTWGQACDLCDSHLMRIDNSAGSVENRTNHRSGFSDCWALVGMSLSDLLSIAMPRFFDQSIRLELLLYHWVMVLFLNSCHSVSQRLDV